MAASPAFRCARPQVMRSHRRLYIVGISSNRCCSRKGRNSLNLSGSYKALEQRGPSYYDEQALVALVLARAQHTVLPMEYLCLPDVEEIRNPSAVAHHYVAKAKQGYFQEAWKGVLLTSRAIPATSSRTRESAPVVN